MLARARLILEELLDGNTRFREVRSRSYRYHRHSLSDLASGQAPRAAVITCVDSRVAPEIIFDQPLGSMLVARVPGNVASESARWMLDIAIEELHVPLVLVLGHACCRAVQQVIEGKPDIAHEALLGGIKEAMARAGQDATDDLYMRTIVENARQTAQELLRDSQDLRQGIADGTTDIAAAVFDIESGRVTVLDRGAAECSFLDSSDGSVTASR